MVRCKNKFIYLRDLTKALPYPDRSFDFDLYMDALPKNPNKGGHRTDLPTHPWLTVQTKQLLVLGTLLPWPPALVVMRSSAVLHGWNRSKPVTPVPHVHFGPTMSSWLHAFRTSRARVFSGPPNEDLPTSRTTLATGIPVRRNRGAAPGTRAVPPVRRERNVSRDGTSLFP